MSEMKYSDEIIERMGKEQRTLTKHERSELREAYLWEKEEEAKNNSTLAQSVRDFKDEKDPLNMPRHRVHTKCQAFLECPIDYKCRSYDSSYMACRSCTLAETDDVCRKPHIHNERTFNMLIKRDRIDLDG